MSFPRYVAYKDSGVEWLGQVPGHWEIKSIRYILDAIGDVDHFMPESVEKGVPYLMTGDLKEFVSDVSLDDCKQVSHNDYLELSKRIKSSKGDVIMARYATIGTSMYVDIDVDFLVSYSCVTLKSNHSKVIGFHLFQYMKSDAFRQGVENQINTNTQGNVGIKDLQNVKIAVAPIDEQTQIAAFLDRETAKIDALVAEQRRLMALLKEKRQAVISHAVTRGLNPRAPLKPSGIEWLGDVPEHWEVKRVKHVASRISSGKTPSGGSEVYVEEGITFLRSQNVYDEGLRLDEVAFITEAVDESMAVSRVLSDDILLNITGASIGRSCVVPGNFPPANVNQHVCVIRLQDLSKVPFVGWAFKSTGIKNQIDHAQNGAAREGLNFVQIGEMTLALPPIGEQFAICSFLDRESANFVTLTTEAQRAIDLLQERRTALISAAVTGQIDVRKAVTTKE